MFLLFGGKKDFNVTALDKVLKSKGIDHCSILIEENHVGSLIWDLVTDRLVINEEEIKPSAVFLRNDVFGSVESNTYLSHSWYTTLRSWALAHPKVSMFNKGYIGMNKSYNLCLAKSIGFDIPRTLITNQMDTLATLENQNQFIIKPVAGGEYTKLLDHYISDLPQRKNNHNTLCFLQTKLLQPEMRIYGIGTSFFGFWVKSEQLDYRTDQKTQLIPCEPPSELCKSMEKLMKKLNLDYAAADFKTCPKTNKLLFLEINSGPMFALFDKVSDGKITESILDWHNCMIHQE